MKNRWITLTLVLLALVMLGASGCRTKKPGTTYDINAPYGEDGGQIILGFDEFGNPIYGSADLAQGYRPDGAEMANSEYAPVLFAYDSQQLNPSEMYKVELVATYLQQNPTHGVIVEGHCDERGSNEYNLSLGEQRALSVRAALIARGIDGVRIHTRSYGKERPVAFGHDESSWSLNRRSEFIFTQM